MLFSPLARGRSVLGAAPPELLVLGSGGWHWGELKAACAARGCGVARLTFEACHLAPDGVRLGDLPGLPGAVLVRAIPAGSFEQVTLRLSLLHALKASGVLVLNDANSIERCVDKAMTSFLLNRARVPTPPFWAVESLDEARRIALAETGQGHRLVAKPLFGAQGQGLSLIEHPNQLPPAEAVAGVWYLQRYVGRSEAWHDYRVLVVDGAAVAAMRRRGTGWITNIRQGATPEPVPATGALAATAIAASRAVGAFYAGVDLIETESGLTVLEVNAMPAWQGLQSVSEVGVAGALVTAIQARLRP